ncbi:MAG: hypothetical protein CVU22_20315 [Betaproteobacteria bacterium HGW-Betaproteobacteria-16]|nr:MAG: hypothetical protein CVU22_20315 [Betaproteobacteria bacterium HGW-Betaproteobacteria-16]
MTAGVVPLLRGLGVAALAVAWAVGAHVASASGEPSHWGAALAIAPLALALGLALWRLPHRWLAALAAGAALALLAWTWPALTSEVALLYFVQHVGVNLLLAAFFGRTLSGPGESLITQLARKVHGGVLSERQVAYTRWVTKAWTVFFLSLVAVSTALFLLAPVTVWSVFANLLGAPLIGSMFVGEYLWRLRCLPAHERSTFADAVRAWKNHGSDPEK